MTNIGDFYLKIFSFLDVKFSIYLNRLVFVIQQTVDEPYSSDSVCCVGSFYLFLEIII